MYILQDGDKAWIRDVILRGHDVAPFVSATIVGQLDAPTRVVLYPQAGFKGEPVTYARTKDGQYVRDRRNPRRSWARGR